MKTALMVMLLAVAATPASTAPAKPPRPAAVETIRLHAGVPGTVFIGEPLVEFLARFPGAKSSPFAGQTDVVRLQVQSDGISALAMGPTPAVMTVESIGFNFEGTYEGIGPGKWRTAEGIGAGSTVNDLLGAYGKPAEMTPEARRGTLSPQRPATEPAGPMRYLYRNEDASVATYFVVQDTRVVRMAMSRLASVEKYLMKPGPAKHGPAPAPGSAPAPGAPKGGAAPPPSSGHP
jgi:hypothetical protein